jgi:Ion channel
MKSSESSLPAPHLWTPWELYFNYIILSVCFMGSIMYGDIIPFTLAEEVVSIFEMLIGRVFIAFLFAEVANYVSQQYSAYDDHTHH